MKKALIIICISTFIIAILGITQHGVEDVFNYVKINNDLSVTGKIESDSFYGQIYTSSGITKATIPTNTYITITGFTLDGSNNTVLTDSTITIPANGNGLWHLGYYANSVTHADNNTTVHISLFIDDVEYDVVEGERKISVAGDIGSFAAGGYKVLSGGEVLKLKVKGDNADDFSSGHFNFYAVMNN